MTATVIIRVRGHRHESYSGGPGGVPRRPPARRRRSHCDRAAVTVTVTSHRRGDSDGHGDRDRDGPPSKRARSRSP